MHDTAYAIGKKFLELYGPTDPFLVVEIGSQDVNGTLKSALPPHASYVGLDMEAAKNVDVVARGAALPIGTASADIVLGSSVFEHDPTFWITMLELCRITKPGGYIYVSAPSNGVVHRYPQDSWRFYPDAAPSLVDWARLNGHSVDLIESFTTARQLDMWNDFVAIFAIPPVTAPVDFVHRHFHTWNIHQFGTDDLLTPQSLTEDEHLLGHAIAALLALESKVNVGGTRPEALKSAIIRMIRLIPAGGVPDHSEPNFLTSPAGKPFAALFDALDRALDDAARWRSELLAATTLREASLRERLTAPGTSAGLSRQKRLNSPESIWYRIDVLEADRISGWAMNGLDPTLRLTVTIRHQGIAIASCLAGEERPDLVRLGYGDGRYGFTCSLPQSATSLRDYTIEASWEGSRAILPPRNRDDLSITGALSPPGETSYRPSPDG